MADFETMPVGTALKLRQLENENARLKRAVNSLLPIARRQIQVGTELVDTIEGMVKP